MSSYNELYAAKTVAESFAKVTDLPWIVKQGRLDELREYTGAADHADFDLTTHLDPEGKIANLGRLYSLPFRLSFGLHVAIEPVINWQLADAFYQVYRGTEPLRPTQARSKSQLLQRKFVEDQKARRAEKAVVGALLGAAADGISPDSVGIRVVFAKQTRMIGRLSALSVRDALKPLKAE